MINFKSQPQILKTYYLVKLSYIKLRDKALSLNLSRTLKTINMKKQILFMSAVALSMSLMSCNDSSKETPEEKMRRVEQDRQ